MPLLGFDLVGGALHVLMVVVAVVVFAFWPRRRTWFTRSLPVLLWLVLAGIDLLVSKGSFQPLLFAVYAAALAIPLAVGLTAVAVVRRMSLARPWQAIAGTVAGIVAMLAWPVFLLMFGCAITGECL